MLRMGLRDWDFGGSNLFYYNSSYPYIHKFVWELRGIWALKVCIYVNFIAIYVKLTVSWLCWHKEYWNPISIDSLLWCRPIILVRSWGKRKSDSLAFLIRGWHMLLTFCHLSVLSLHLWKWCPLNYFLDLHTFPPLTMDFPMYYPWFHFLSFQTGEICYCS